MEYFIVIIFKISNVVANVVCVYTYVCSNLESLSYENLQFETSCNAVIYLISYYLNCTTHD